jgi:hypothetical protein
MLSRRKTWLSALVLTLGVLSATSVARAADEVAIDPLVPSDAEILAGINVRSILDSPLMKKKGQEELKAALKKNADLMKVLDATGLDPFKDIDTITMANSGGLTNGKVLLVARGRFNLDKIHTTAEAVAKDKPDHLKILKEGNVTVYELKGEGANADKPGYAAFADNKTLIVTTSKPYTLEMAQAGGKTSNKPTKEMQDALSKLSGKESVWMAALITEEMKQALKANPQMAPLAPKLHFVTGGLTLSDGLLLGLQVHTADAQTAGKVKMMIAGIKPFLQLAAQSNEEMGPVINELLENLKIESNKNAATVSLKVTEEMMEKTKKDKDKDKDK